MTKFVLLALLKYQVRICWVEYEILRSNEFAISSRVSL